MREVDEALARAYSHREKAEPARGVPPAPHWPSHAVARRVGALSPGEAVEPSHSDSSVELQWPGVVLGLERDCGDRFDELAASLIEIHHRTDIRAILFTSCHRAEGRTTLILTLARALARHPVRTALVDADLAGPMIARLLGLRPERGLEDVVEGGLSLADGLIEAADDHLTVLPIRSAVARPREFLASPAWSATLARLRRDHELILLDGGPLFNGLSASTIHREVDAAVLVYHRELTGLRTLARARETLGSAGIPLLGLAETFV